MIMAEVMWMRIAMDSGTLPAKGMPVTQELACRSLSWRSGVADGQWLYGTVVRIRDVAVRWWRSGAL